MRCDASAENCEWEGTLSALKEHAGKCGFNLFDCTNRCRVKGNVQSLLRKKLDEHGCSVMLQRRDMPEHENDVTKTIFISRLQDKLDKQVKMTHATTGIFMKGIVVIELNIRHMEH